MKEQKYKVLILASGIGVRLGEITEYTNKSLVKVGKKPAISYIIEAYPKNTEMVVTLGYFGNQVRDFLKLAYPERKITFVEVDKFNGKGASIGYSMLKAKKHLQCPFIYQAGDTVVTDHISNLKNNWIGGYRGQESSHYNSFNTLNGKVQGIIDKGAIDSDYLHIGLVGFYNYEKFWKLLEKAYKKNPDNKGLNDSYIINKMIEDGEDFSIQEFKCWYDTGNVDSLQKARKKIADSFHILDKLEEAIFLFKDFVIKFFYKDDMVRDRVARGNILKGLVPKIEGSTKNFYRYKYAKGDLFSEVANPENFKVFLQWAKKSLWKKTHEVSEADFKKICYDFYYTKSLERINKFLISRGVKDKITEINGEKISPVKDIFKKIDFNWLSEAQQTHFHGDFIPDNIVKTKKGFVLLDWRQNFGGLLKAGDMYYDLAKLNHNLTVNHGIVNDNLFTIQISGNNVKCDIMRKDNLVKCQEELFEFVRREKLDEKKIRILTALIWLNMSPLHHHPFDLFLFYFGKLNLWRELKKK